MPIASRGACRFHQLVEYDGGLVLAAVSFGLEAYAVNRTIHFWNPQDFLQLLGDWAAFRKVDCFAAERVGVFQPCSIEIRDDHHCRAEQKRRGCGRQSYRACAGDEHG